MTTRLRIGSALAVLAALTWVTPGCTFDDTQGHAGGAAAEAIVGSAPDNVTPVSDSTTAGDGGGVIYTDNPDGNGDPALCDSTTSSLYATPLGGALGVEVGTVTASNTDTVLRLVLSTASNAENISIDEVWVYAGVDPVPATGDQVDYLTFPYHWTVSPSATTVTVEIPLSETGASCGEVVNVGVWARVHSSGTPKADVITDPGYPRGAFPLTICCPPPPEEPGCTLTQGYWKNHNRYATNPSQQIPWPIDEDTLLCGSTWLDLLNTPPRGGDAWLILAHQWIAAELNAASGADTTVIDDALGYGEDLLNGNCDGFTGDLRDEALTLAGNFDDYNNGVTGPGHCDETGGDTGGGDTGGGDTGGGDTGGGDTGGGDTGGGDTGGGDTGGGDTGGGDQGHGGCDGGGGAGGHHGGHHEGHHGGSSSGDDGGHAGHGATGSGGDDDGPGHVGYIDTNGDGHCDNAAHHHHRH